MKKKVLVNVSFEEAEKASQLFAEKHNALFKVMAQMNDEVNKVRSKYADRITEYQEALKEPMEVLEVYGVENKDSWAKKSLDLLHCTIGFRTGTPKVCKDKAFTWEAVLNLVKAKANLKKLFVRTKEELNKEEILKTTDKKLLKQLQDQAYITIEQEETFYVEAKQEELSLV